MIAHGVRPGSTVVTLIPNGIESLLLPWISAVMKLTLAPLDVCALTSPRRIELVERMRTLQLDVVIVPTTSDAAAIDAARLHVGEPLPGMRVCPDGDNAPRNSCTTLTCLARDGSGHKIDLQKLLDTAQIGVDSVVLYSTANFRVIAPFTAAAVWRAGGTVVMPGTAFTPEVVLDALERHSITHMLLLPFQIYSIIAHPTFRNRHTGTLRTVLTGADTVNKDLLVKMAANFPSAAVCTAHRTTEGGAFLAWIWYDTPPGRLPYFGEISPLGKIAAGSRLRIWNHESGKVARRGELGELHVSSDVAIRHYLGSRNEDSFYFDDLGRWFKTGDLGIIDADGVVYVLGRIKDVVMRAGIPITPAALKSSIGNFTGVLVSEASVVAIRRSFSGRSLLQCYKATTAKARRM
ncbi:hypothetical protein LTR56_026816 [Elasticomyces elasticus]|nr:hypothetical protein LTR56_026816 [Elasticomyces elasticus]KAK4903577.1 hypothetical protein LTR49_026801 [Elasticomyces elasticus]